MKRTILFLAADPGGTDAQALEHEAHSIQVELERGGREFFEFQSRWAVEPLDLLRELRRLKPAVVHFSGHGGRGLAGYRPGQAVRRDVGVDGLGRPDRGAPEGLVFQAADGRAQSVPAEAIAAAFAAAGGSVKLVVLSACYTDVQAEALLAHVDCVIGMGGSIGDDAARSFAIGFYGGLGVREPVMTAYDQGRAAISLEGLPDADLPRLRIRAGVDARRLVLAEPELGAAPWPEPRPMVRQVRAAQYVEQVHGNQVIHMAPETTELEREARLRMVERAQRAQLDALYRSDPLMQHRHSEAAVIRTAAGAFAIVGALVLALVLAQKPLGMAVLVGAGIAACLLVVSRTRKERKKPPGT